MAKEEKKIYAGTGHRKSSIARVKLIPGKGKISVNGRDVDMHVYVQATLNKRKSVKRIGKPIRILNTKVLQ